MNRKPKKVKETSDRDQVNALLLQSIRRRLESEADDLIKKLSVAKLVEAGIRLTHSVEPKADEGLPANLEEHARRCLEKYLQHKGINMEISDHMVARAMAANDRYSEAFARIVAGEPD